MEIMRDRWAKTHLFEEQLFLYLYPKIRTGSNR